MTLWWLACSVADPPPPPADLPLLDRVDALGRAPLGPEGVATVLGVPLAAQDPTGWYASWRSAEAAPGHVLLLVARSGAAPDGGALFYELPPDAPCSRLDEALARYGFGARRPPPHGDRQVDQEVWAWQLPWADLDLSYAEGCATNVRLTLPRTDEGPALLERVERVADDVPFRPERVAAGLAVPPLRVTTSDRFPTRWDGAGGDVAHVELRAGAVGGDAGERLDFDHRDRFVCASRAEAEARFGPGEEIPPTTWNVRLHRRYALRRAVLDLWFDDEGCAKHVQLVALP